MANGWGGKREGAGRKGSVARDLMRRIALNPTCVKRAMRYAGKNPEFWLRCFEAGFGRPPQAIGLTVEDKRERYQVILADGTHEVPGLTTTSTLPAGDTN